MPIWGCPMTDMITPQRRENSPVLAGTIGTQRVHPPYTAAPQKFEGASDA